MGESRKVLIVDDNPLVLSWWTIFLEEHYSDLDIFTFEDPVQAMPHMTPDVHLLLMDLEMPVMDGMKLLEHAARQGVRRNRTIILSSKDADVLHRMFPHGACLAVINKDDPRQQTVLYEILNSIMRRKR